MDIKQITFGLENCDAITIDGKDISRLKIDNIGRSIRKVGSVYVSNSYIAKDFAIKIDKRANIRYKQFGCLAETYIFARLTSFPDIVDVVVTLIDDDGSVSKYSILLDWAGDSDEINEAQTTCFNESGDLYIVVSKNEQASDIVKLF